MGAMRDEVDRGEETKWKDGDWTASNDTQHLT